MCTVALLEAGRPIADSSSVGTAPRPFCRGNELMEMDDVMQVSKSLIKGSELDGGRESGRFHDDHPVPRFGRRT